VTWDMRTWLTWFSGWALLYALILIGFTIGSLATGHPLRVASFSIWVGVGFAAATAGVAVWQLGRRGAR
jgi:hypothetical protein